MRSGWSERRLLLLRALGTALALGLLVILFREEGWGEVTSLLRRISAGELLLALALLMISRLCVIARWHVLLRSAGTPIPFARTTSLTFTGLFASNFLPTTIGGDVVRLTGAIRMGLDRAVCLASLVADRLIGMIGMLFAVPFGLVPLLASPGGLQAATLAGFARKLRELSVEALRAFSIWARKPQALLASFLCTFAHMAAVFAAVSVLITGLHAHVPYPLVAGIWSLAYFVTLIPISINGYGVQELSASFLLARVGGLGTAESLSVAILARAIFIFASLPGALFLPTIMEAVAQTRKSDTGQ